MIQIHFYKKNFDAQKAERFFKERRVQAQMIDLSRVPMGTPATAVSTST